MDGPRRPLGAGVRTLVVIDALLVLIFVFLLGQHGYLNGTGTPSGESANPTPTVTAEPVRFASPTRNIGCTITPEAANCEIAQFMYAAPTLEGCAGDVGHEIEVTADGAHWVCRTGDPPPAPSPDVADLDWGESTSAYGFTCTSENDGVTCAHDQSGNSFSLARRVVTLT